MNSVSFKDRLGLLSVLFYFVLCFLLIVADNGQSIEVPTGKEVNMLKALQVITSTLLFILPATLFCRFLRPERTLFLNMNHMPHAYFMITAVATIFFALPAVSGLGVWNQAIHLPASMGNIEDWMRQKENDAEKIYMAFFEDKSMGGLAINLIVMAFIAALSEEIFFRGLIQQMFLKNKINPHVAIVITAILFSAFHLQFFGFIPRLFLGLILGYLYYYTQNLWVSIIAHFFNNAFAVIAATVYSEDILSSGEKGQDTNPLLVILSIAMVVAQFYFLQRFITRTKS